MTGFGYDTHLVFSGSSALTDAYYAAKTQELVLAFAGGNMAGYKNVPAHVITSFGRATSAGSYYNYYIKNKYTGFPVSLNMMFFDNSSGYPQTTNVVPDTRAAATSLVPEWKVTVKFDGTLELKVRESDAAAALDNVRAMLNNALADGGKYEFLGVNKV